MPEKKKQELKLQIQLDEQTAQGIYSNLVVANHSEGEFVLDFVFVQPQVPQAKVRSRVIVSPRQAKRLLRTLGDNVRKYEEKFGTIQDVIPSTVEDEGPFH